MLLLIDTGAKRCNLSRGIVHFNDFHAVDGTISSVLPPTFTPISLITTNWCFNFSVCLLTNGIILVLRSLFFVSHALVPIFFSAHNIYSASALAAASSSSCCLVTVAAY